MEGLVRDVKVGSGKEEVGIEVQAAVVQVMMTSGEVSMEDTEVKVATEEEVTEEEDLVEVLVSNKGLRFSMEALAMVAKGASKAEASGDSYALRNDINTQYKSQMDLFIYFTFDSLDNILIVPDNPVFLLDLLLEGHPEILNSG